MASYPSELSWLPDWWDASQYPDPESTTGTQWGWEFLRRNPAYQKAWSELTRDIADMEEIRRLFNICERFHLIDGIMPPDPRSNEDPRLSFQAAWMRSYSYNERHPDQVITVSKGKILIELDLSLPVETELQKARKIFVEYRHEIDKVRTGKLADFLRILDAKQDLSKPSLREIAQAIYSKETSGNVFERDDSHRQKVAANQEAALRFRDEDFWKLPTLALLSNK